MNAPPVLASTILSSLTVWQLFKRYEPTGFISSALLLLVVPAIIASNAGPLPLGISSTATTFLLYWGLLITYIVLYRLSPFHPLAKYPGPLRCKISKGWMAYVAARGDMHRYVNQLHARYGDAVRVGPNELSFRHGDLVDPILANKELHKSTYYDLRVRNGVAPLDAIKDYGEHAARRRLWNRGTSATMTKIYTRNLVGVVDEFIQALSERQGQRLDMSHWLSYATTDFMGHMTFSTSFDMVSKGCDHNGLVKLVEDTAYACHIIGHIPWSFHYLSKLPGATKAIDEGLRIGREVARKRKELGSETRDLYYYLLDEDGLEDVKPSEDSALAEGFLAIIAGAETTATAATNALYFLLKHPETMKRLQKEIHDALSATSDDVDYTKFMELPYLNACINETFRLLSPGLTGLSRELDVSGGDKMLGHYFVPAGTKVSAHLYSIQRDPRYFSPLPDTFWPDRWLNQVSYTLPSGETLSKEEIVLKREVVLPFSTGQQGCAGRNIANLELRSLLVSLLHRFDIRAADGFRIDEYEETLSDAYVTIRKPLYIQLRELQ